MLISNFRDDEKYIISVGGFVFFCSSCGDFLEEYSQNSTYVESVDDLDELLLGGGYLTRNVREHFCHGSDGLLAYHG